MVQGVGYPNPDRSHFESMDVWHSADPTRKTTTGWLGRSVNELHNTTGGIPIMHVGPNRLPLALTGATGGAISVNNQQPLPIKLGGGDPDRQKAARRATARRPRPAGRGTTPRTAACSSSSTAARCRR